MTGKLVFDQISLVARDVAKSAAFYGTLGVSFPNRGDHTTYHATADGLDGLDFTLDRTDFAEYWNPGWAGRADLAGRVVVGFRVESRAEVDAKCATIAKAGYKVLTEPHDAFWGARYAVVEDPDGVAVGIMSPSDPAMRVWPPRGWNP